MRRVLVTGFEPFEGETLNPSWEVIMQLENTQLSGMALSVRQLPCVFHRSIALLQQAIDELQPEIVIAVGQAGGRADISLERVAINVDDARIADNAGNQPIDRSIVPDGPAAYFSRLPIKAIVANLRQAGIPASVSHSAGTFVCNHVMYGLLHHIARLPEVKGGFVHIPYLPEQAANKPGMPSMAIPTVLTALQLIILISQKTQQDLQQSEGTTH
jgi:pyroglutamyl-peptidase